MSSNDSRFAGVSTDPRFRRAPRSERKIVLDERFSKMLTDERFLMSEHRDPRGRPFTKSHREDLARYFSPEDKSGDRSEQLRSNSRGQFINELHKDEEEGTDNDEQNESEDVLSELSAESDESDDAVDEDELRAATG